MLDRDFKGVWIPKVIWLDKNLTWSEKILLVEIDSLCNLGQCFAFNEHFSEFLGLSKDRVTKLISSLKDKGYIESYLVYKDDSKQVEKRVITTVGYRRKQLEGIGENDGTPLGENAEDNNTTFNNTNYKNKKSDMYDSIFKEYLNAGLIKHTKFTPNMKKAIDLAKKQFGLTETDFINIIHRHKEKCESTKNSQYPVRPRPLAELFGQKKYGSVSLVCSDYLDDVWQPIKNEPNTKNETIKDGVKYEGGLRVYE